MALKRRLLVVPALVATVTLVTACASGKTAPATDVTDTSATLNGSVSSGKDGTISYWFEYGKTIAYGNETGRSTLAITDRNGHPVTAPLGGLESETTYHFRVCARFGGLKPGCGSDESFTTTTPPPPTELSITTQPELYPTFTPGVSDYVTRCGSEPVAVHVAAPAGTSVSVNGQPGQTGRFSQTVALSPGQRFDLSTTVDSATSTFYVRCLPGDFPTWTYERRAEPTQDWTLLSVSKGTARYATFFDRHGTPVWWYSPPFNPTDVKLLSDNTIAFAQGRGVAFGLPDTVYEIRDLDGDLVRTLQTVDAPTDHHDLQEVGSGNFLLLSYKPRAGVDLSAYGGPEDATVLDAEIQELTPEDTVAWSWNSKDHIALDETGGWWPFLIANPSAYGSGVVYDPVHINAVEPDGDSVLLSLRHTDAIYRVSRVTGEVQWKLGGTTTDKSLTVVDDPNSPPLAGQHDVRRLADGTVSVHDNGTRFPRPPRAARYEIDLDAKTATLVESVADEEITSSTCCGSARKLDSGNWLVDWGAFSSPTIAEYTTSGARVFKLNFPGAFAYRAFPVPAGRINAAALRQAMDAIAPPR
jgi:hypothetical protein